MMRGGLRRRRVGSMMDFEGIDKNTFMGNGFRSGVE
jgi:hypothetical protein